MQSDEQEIRHPARRRSIREAWGHTLSILRKQSGKWVLARDANMLAPA